MERIISDIFRKEMRNDRFRYKISIIKIISMIKSMQILFEKMSLEYFSYKNIKFEIIKL